GQWQVITYAGNKPYPSKMIINQNGTQFAGQGQDGFGLFEVAGILRPPARMDFKKSYDKEAERKGAITEPMIYSGTLETDPTTNLLTVSGGWKSHKRQGFESSIYHPAEMVEIGGRYQAKQLMAQTPAAPSNNVLASLPHLNAGGMNPLGALAPGHGTNKIETAQHTFLTIALACIGVGVLIFLFFLMLFGPSGKMNVWEKQKYIPSQFKAQHMKMVRELGKTLTPGATPFGKRLEWDWWCPFTPKSLALPADLRVQNPHMLIMGGGDKGKTRLIAHMISHDIRSADRAVVVIDSDGQLSDMVIEWIASQPEGKEFSKRVILVDPTYKAGSVAYNPLEMPEDGDLQAASSAIVHGFKAIYTEPPGAQSQWNAQTANILRNASLLLMANGRTLTDLPNLLQDNDFRDIMLESVERRKSEKTEYITLLETWNQYKKLARTDQWINWVEPILNRVGPMLSDGRIRPILTKPVSDLKLKELIIDRKILIVKVPQGELDQNANLLGSLIVTGLQQAAMSMSKGKREVEVRPVALYIDEMDNFIEKETIENLTSETKRYQVGFVGCLKTLQHLPEDYRSQLIINMGTLCVFALAKKDGDMLGPQMFRVDGRKIKHQTIQNFFNKVNTSPQFELIMDEEKLNIDRIVGQEMQTYFCYRVGTVAGTFKLKAHDFKDPPERKIDRRLVDKMHALVDDVDDKKKSRKKKGK
ncbi:MAG: type IV secretion system DNA-binding domain-containing protein, partial [Candidatus Obscuribacterales bacterium]|nr:type IV secretion system DNA-binding domain-containing protein [Candidatus Obscuribacterales bacterium]